jgi:hypothetical protein
LVHSEIEGRPGSVVGVVLKKSNELWRKGQGRKKNIRFGTLEAHALQIIQALLDVGCTIELHCTCSPVTSVENCIGPYTAQTRKEGVVELNIIIYGPRLLSGSLEEWLLENALFLQDPIYCEKDVVYKNPQLLCEDTEEVTKTFSLKSYLQDADIERIETRPDLFELLNEGHCLDETEAPRAVLTPLYRCAANQSRSYYD